MATLNFVGYQAQSSPLHRLDSRFKLAWLFFHHTCCLLLSNWSLCIVALGLLALWQLGKLRWAALLNGLKAVLFITILSFVLNSWALPQRTSELWLQWHGIVITYLQINYFCRLLLLFIASHILIACTSLSQLSRAIDWWVRPIPVVRNIPLGLLLRLCVGMIPVLYDIAMQVQNAQTARNVAQKRSSISRLYYFALAFTTKSIKKTQDIAAAMTARAYTGQPSSYAKSWHWHNTLAMIIVLLWYSIAAYLPVIMAW